MPSPFPGMDPFLEDPAVFPDLHDSMIAYLREVLNAVLPAPYRAGIGSRIWVEPSHRRFGPDVKVLHRTHPVNGGVKPGVGAGGVAVAEVAATEPVAIEVEIEEQQETFLEIYAEPGGRRVVTTIEVLSPANKTPGGHGRTPYLQKQNEMMRSQVHLVEIDLLRGGVHTTAVPIDAAVARLGFFDYHVCVHRWDQSNTYYVYPIQLQCRLPSVTTPLLPDDPPVAFDLKAVLDRAYDAGRYRDWVPYREAVPPPPLHPNQAIWVEEILRAAGLREPPPAAPAP